MHSGTFCQCSLGAEGYRPFDFRYVFNSTLLVDWPRPEVSEQMHSGNNLGLCLVRRTENTRDYDYFSVSRDTISNHQVSLKDGTYLLPLYLEKIGRQQGMFSHERERRPNLSDCAEISAAKTPKGTSIRARLFRKWRLTMFSAVPIPAAQHPLGPNFQHGFRQPPRFCLPAPQVLALSKTSR